MQIPYWIPLTVYLVFAAGAAEPIRGVARSAAMDGAGNVYVTGFGGTARYMEDMQLDWRKQDLSGVAVEVDLEGNAWVLSGEWFASNSENLSLTKLKDSMDVAWSIQSTNLPYPALSRHWVLDADEGRAYFAVSNNASIQIVGVDHQGATEMVAEYLPDSPLRARKVLRHGKAIWLLLTTAVEEWEGPEIKTFIIYDSESGEVGDPVVLEPEFSVADATVDPSGNIYLVGSSSSETEDWIHVAKHNSAGSLFWEEKITARVRERRWEPVQIKADSSRNCYIIANGPNYDGREYIHGYRVWKHDRHGNQAWSEGYVGYHPLLADWAEELVVTPGGVSAIAVRSLNNTYGAPIFGFETSFFGPNGNSPNYGPSVGTIPSDEIHEIKVTADGTILVTGEDWDSGDPYYAVSKRIPNPGLAILESPVGRTVPAGGSAILSVRTTIDGPWTYEWRKDGVVIVGGTNRVIQLTNFQETDAGGYTVQVSNGDLHLTSESAFLSIGPERISHFDSITWVAPGLLRLDLNTLIDGVPYRIETSTNLRDWTLVEELRSTTGTMRVFTELSLSSERSFYRLVERP